MSQLPDSTCRRFASLASLLSAVAFLSSGCSPLRAPTPPVLQADQYLVGAHYYTWHPENFRLGTLRSLLIPPQTPELGLYDSCDTRVIEQHIAWCSQYGIDFLALDWWPTRRERNERFMAAFLRVPNLADIRFCIHYETWALGFNRDAGATAITTPKADRLVADLLELADRYFSHPSYLRVAGRPVVILYLTRTLAGPYDHALAAVRRALERKGHDVFLIGDEIFWKVYPDSPVRARGPLPLTPKPQERRVRLFDAITGYNPYESEIAAHRGYAATNAFFDDVAALYEGYRQVAAGRVCMVPDIIPGYNDRGVRTRADHYAIPRQTAAGAAEGSFFAAAWDRLAFPFVDPRLNMVLITSWNEWNEDTAIEPLAEAPPTTRDGGSPGDYHTMGFAYAGHGTRYLDIVRQKVVAACGRLTDEAGAAAPGLAVTARQGDRVVVTRTDSRGYYRFSRLAFRGGNVEIALAGQPAARTVALAPDAPVTDVDFIIPAHPVPTPPTINRQPSALPP